jgi:hypothetical protein
MAYALTPQPHCLKTFVGADRPILGLNYGLILGLNDLAVPLNAWVIAFRLNPPPSSGFECSCGRLDVKIAGGVSFVQSAKGRSGRGAPFSDDFRPLAKLRHDPQARRSWTVRSMPLGGDQRPIPMRRLKLHDG